MKRTIIYIVLITLFTLQTQAQDKKAALEELFKVMQVEKMTSKMMDNIIPVLKQQAQQSFKTEKDKVNFSTYIKFIHKETKALSIKLATEEMPLIYKKHFTLEDIKYLTNFYKSTTGQKLLEKTPEISKELVQSMMTKYMPEFQSKMKTKLQELKQAKPQQ